MPSYGFRHLQPAWTDNLDDGGAAMAVFRLLEGMARCGLEPGMLSREAREALREMQWQSSCLQAACAEVFAPAQLRLDEVARRARLTRRSGFQGPDVALSARLDPAKGLVLSWDPDGDEDAFLRRGAAREDGAGARELAAMKWFGKILPGAGSREPGTCEECDERAVRGHLAAAAVRLYRDAVDALGIGCCVSEASRLSVALDEDTGELLSFGVERLVPGAEREAPSPGM
jgi:hypothetical protein